MKDNLLNSASQNPMSCTGCDLYLLQYHCYQVSWFWSNYQSSLHTLVQSTWWLYVKFMQHCCDRTTGDLFIWHHHYWTSDCLCIFHAIKLWSSSCIMVHLNCQSICVVIQQHLLIEELFSQLPIYVLLLHHCNSNWSIGFQPDCYVNWILSSQVCEEGTSSLLLALPLR